ncbi:SGNH/GDSL hydrolase family protein [Gemmata sp. JC717]|uniref:SGNH/GDSL hydrolase family protein n=1 Tax=Gemmata algarum TaxID=2975278 RepID=UPI0021BAFA26|nr:SGNH/GDSL hydrolase family protein [Gemmata algarum]MDY3553767.1 SGNH/GDSL hydrolase family protein [Gemmata algarum]
MLLSAAFAVLLGTAPAAQPAQALKLKDGDRIVWLGGTLVEREQRYGYWEAALVAANADKNITVRNLGWSGDTVHGESRGRFDFNNPDACFKQIVDQTLALKPTVIFVSYGSNEAFEGKEGLPKFEKGLEKLLDALKPANARIVLFTPIPVNALETQSGAPSPQKRNEMIDLYGKSIQATAQKHGHQFADLNEFVKVVFFTQETFLKDDQKLRSQHPPLTTNGVHLTQDGYQMTATAFIASLGYSSGGRTSEYQKELEPLRQAIVAKNEQFFNKWRPQNETYLFGFRKHEQGKNAKEMAEFDPFIQKAEDEIARLRKGLK